MRRAFHLGIQGISTVDVYWAFLEVEGKSLNRVKAVSALHLYEPAA